MLIDFHTHAFPDAIAPRTIAALKSNIERVSNYEATVYADGTKDGLLASMKQNQVDLSIVLPIATKVTQSTTINTYAKSITNDSCISFGSLHPFQEDWEEVLISLKEQGFLGIKLHPEYQQVHVDSPECVRVLKKATELGLYVTLHTGRDVGVPEPVHCSPKQLRSVLTKVDATHIIAAHFGGWRMWDEVEQYLIDTPIYFDTAVVGDYISKEQYLRMIQTHDASRILFGSDSPWDAPKRTLETLQSLPLSKEELDLITHKNALRIIHEN